MLAIFKRELRAYYQTPSGYIFMSLFLLVGGILFAFGNLVSLSSQFTGFLGSILFMFLLAVPVLTMRLLTEEMRMRTDQLLLTSPIKITEIVLGKYLAALFVFVVTMAITILYAVVIAIFGDLDTSATIGGYIGFLLVGCSFIAVGIFVSATTENQVVSAIVTFAALLIFWIMDAIQNGVPTDSTSGLVFAAAIAVGVAVWIYFSTKSLYLGGAVVLLGAIIIVLLVLFDNSVFTGFIGNVLAWFSLLKRYQDFTRGLLKLDSVVYYLSFSAFFLFMTIRLIEKRRWS